MKSLATAFQTVKAPPPVMQHHTRSMGGCHCPKCGGRPSPRRVGNLTRGVHDGGLGFDIDWSGIANNAIKAYGTIAATRSAITLQRAQQEAALRAQQNELQLMERRQAGMVGQPVGSGYITLPTGGIASVSPSGVIQAPAGVVYGQPQRQYFGPAGGVMAGLPKWALPAALGLGVVLLLRK